MADHLTPQEERQLRQVVARASEQGWGIALGLVCGLGLVLATAILLVRGGETPGAHLSMLSVYFPGYRVTWLGAGIGFVYAFVGGYAAGRSVATFYNWLSPRN
jgi:hypothetical protein